VCVQKTVFWHALYRAGSRSQGTTPGLSLVEQQEVGQGRAVVKARSTAKAAQDLLADVATATPAHHPAPMFQDAGGMWEC